jgi:hypothetical protein
MLHHRREITLVNRHGEDAYPLGARRRGRECDQNLGEEGNLARGEL